VILKSYIVEKNIETLKNYQATLMFGENNGIKDDIIQAIKKQNKDAEIINLFETDILKNSFLYESVTNKSLFTEKKIIFIHEATDKILNQIIECLEKENNDIQIYIICEILEKKSKLRSLFEKSEKLAIFPCYEDNDRTLLSYVNRELKDVKGLTGEIINLIINNSNKNRRVIKSEIKKINNFFFGKKINKQEITEILNIKNNTSFDEIRDGAFNGEKQKINKLLSEVNLLNEDAFYYLNNLNYRTMRLQEIIKISEGNKDRYVQVLENLKPPVFWKDKPIIIRQLKNWSLKKLTQLTIKIAEAEVLMKKKSYLRNDILVKNLIIVLTDKACVTSS